MIKSKTLYNPFVRRNDSTAKVMTDVIIALIPCIAISALGYGFYPIAVVLVSVAGALVAEFLFSAIFSKNTDSIADGSAIVTGILLAFTIGPFTPLYVVAFGAAAAVLFGKMLWGGLGRNRFNPALVGREFMTIFFPLIMNSSSIWNNKELLNVRQVEVFNVDFLDRFIFRVSGSIGEYSPLLLIIGGLFLLYRRRISWHIPLGMLGAFSILMFVFSRFDLSFSFGGLFLGAIYMATDMPTSASSPSGKLYYGIMVGVVCIICLVGGVEHGYFSYAILIMNGFVQPINKMLRPDVWGKKITVSTRIWQTVLVSLAIIATTIVVVWLDGQEWIKYIIYAFVLFCIGRFIWERNRKDNRLGAGN